MPVYYGISKNDNGRKFITRDLVGGILFTATPQSLSAQSWMFVHNVGSPQQFWIRNPYNAFLKSVSNTNGAGIESGTESNASLWQLEPQGVELYKIKLVGTGFYLVPDPNSSNSVMLSTASFTWDIIINDGEIDPIP